MGQRVCLQRRAPRGRKKGCAGFDSHGECPPLSLSVLSSVGRAALQQSACRRFETVSTDHQHRRHSSEAEQPVVCGKAGVSKSPGGAINTTA